jgi:hypothetical protein
MSTRKMRTRQAKQMMQGYMGEINTIAKNASVEDKVGRWGLDPWIRIFHDLVDLQVRTGAAVMRGALAGPWWLQPTPETLDPVPVPVPFADYPRIATASAFVRLWMPEMVIPAASLDLQPDVLPAGATQIRILLKDYQFVGANYKGTIFLRNVDNPKAQPVPVEVIVGL